jgi:hypothetical protein
VYELVELAPLWQNEFLHFHIYKRGRVLGGPCQKVQKIMAIVVKEMIRRHLLRFGIKSNLQIKRKLEHLAAVSTTILKIAICILEISRLCTLLWLELKVIWRLISPENIQILEFRPRDANEPSFHLQITETTDLIRPACKSLLAFKCRSVDSPTIFSQRARMKF